MGTVRRRRGAIRLGVALGSFVFLLAGCSSPISSWSFSALAVSPVLPDTDGVTLEQLKTVLDAFGVDAGEQPIPDAIHQEVRDLAAEPATDRVRVSPYQIRYVGAVGRASFFLSVAGSFVCVHSGWENSRGEFIGGSACGGLAELLHPSQFVVASSDSQTGMAEVIVPSDCRFRVDGTVPHFDLGGVVVVESPELHGDLVCTARPSARIDLTSPDR